MPRPRETHLTNWALEQLELHQVPDTHSNRAAVAAWALASDRETVAAFLGSLGGTVDGDGAEIPATEDQQRVRQALAGGSDAHLVARTVANAGGTDFAPFLDHVLAGDFTPFDPADVEPSEEAVAAQAQAADDLEPATRGDIRALTDAIAELVDVVRNAQPVKS